MRTKEDVGAEKLRGGFYSPDRLVDMCLDRVAALLGPQGELSVLEPSVGDGAFFRGLGRHAIGHRVRTVTGVELVAAEAELAEEARLGADLDGEVLNANVLEWASVSRTRYDVTLGNPPYVRFQFIKPEDRQRASAIASGLGIAASAVSNLWIPVFLLALSRLRDGGAFSMIVPMEFMTGVAAGRVRAWMLRNCDSLSIDLFKPGAFPAVLQEVVVVSGRRKYDSDRDLTATVSFRDHNGGVREWSHSVSSAESTWTAYLLPKRQVEALRIARELPSSKRLGDVARFTVSTVTGANSYFSMSSSEVYERGLGKWAIPLLPRTRHAAGLSFRSTDHDALTETDAAAWLLSFSVDRPPLDDLAREYIGMGEHLKLNERFKCRVRDPWYRVPVVAAGDLLMSKRSNFFPRVIHNEAGVVTTDTIYRGVMLPGAGSTPADFVAGFHNSLTLLSAETQGRSFGGGVLELVPSEIASLSVLNLPGVGARLPELDVVARTGSDDALVEATNRIALIDSLGLDPELVEELAAARMELMNRRLARTSASFYDAKRS